MAKYLNDAPRVKPIIDFTKPEQSEPCDSCRIEGCEFEPNGADCIRRQSIFADSDFYNYDFYNDNRMEIDEERLKADRQFSEHTINW